MKGMKRLMVAAILLATACFAVTRAQALELKIAHVLPTNEAVHEILLEMGKHLEGNSNGYFKVNVYANSELGSDKDCLEMIRRGANIITACDCGYLADYVPAYGAMNGPFLYNDWKEIVRLNHSEWHKNIMAECAEKGFKILAMDWYFGRRHVISNKVIRQPADLNGMKIRVPPKKVWIETVTAMGGLPTVLQWSEVYSALSQGVVEGAEAPLSTIYGSKLHEVRKNISETSHFTASSGMTISQKVWDSMPAEYQEMPQKAVDEYGLKCSILTAQREEEWKKRLQDEGVLFNAVDGAAFAKACTVVYNDPDWPSYQELRVQIEKTPFPFADDE